MDDKITKKKIDFDAKVQELGNGIKKSLKWLTERDGRIIVDGISVLIPFVTGSPFGTMLPFLIECADYSVRQRFLKNYPDITSRLDKIKPFMNEDFIKSELGQKFLRDTFKQIVEETDAEKLEFQKKFLLNAFTQTDPNIERLVTFQNILLSLEAPQLRIISALSNFEFTVRQIIIKRDESKPTFPIDLRGDVRRLLKIDNEIFERAITRLETDKLIARDGLEISWCGGAYDQRFVDQAREKMESALQRLVTPLGKEFVSYFKDNS